MSQAIQNGSIYKDVNFVDKREDAEIEIVYDEVRYDKDLDTWMYLYHGYVVAVNGG